MAKSAYCHCKWEDSLVLGFVPVLVWRKQKHRMFGSPVSIYNESLSERSPFWPMKFDKAIKKICPAVPNRKISDLEWQKTKKSSNFYFSKVTLNTVRLQSEINANHSFYLVTSCFSVNHWVHKCGWTMSIPRVIARKRFNQSSYVSKRLVRLILQTSQFSTVLKCLKSYSQIYPVSSDMWVIMKLISRLSVMKHLSCVHTAVASVSLFRGKPFCFCCCCLLAFLLPARHRLQLILNDSENGTAVCGAAGNVSASRPL